CLQYSNSPYTF
nr:immunoglobulin light chain junction region [Macaca mulatta]